MYSKLQRHSISGKSNSSTNLCTESIRMWSRWHYQEIYAVGTNTKINCAQEGPGALVFKMIKFYALAEGIFGESLHCITMFSHHYIQWLINIKLYFVAGVIMKIFVKNTSVVSTEVFDDSVKSVFSNVKDWNERLSSQYNKKDAT